jgi:hypothetical protein
VEIKGHWRRPPDRWAESPHNNYLREARARGERTYADLEEVFFFPRPCVRAVAGRMERRTKYLLTF